MELLRLVEIGVGGRGFGLRRGWVRAMTLLSAETCVRGPVLDCDHEDLFDTTKELLSNCADRRLEASCNRKCQLGMSVTHHAYSQ
jgi:hypothetical protein